MRFVIVAGVLLPLIDCPDGAVMFQYFIKVVPTRYIKLNGNTVRSASSFEDTAILDNFSGVIIFEGLYGR